MTKAILIVLTFALAASAASKEEKLADAVRKDNAQIVRWQEKAQKDGLAWDTFCQAQGKRAGEKAALVGGCIVWQGAPLPPPNTTTTTRKP